MYCSSKIAIQRDTPVNDVAKCVSIHDLASASAIYLALGTGQQLQSTTFSKALAVRHVACGLSQKLCLCVGTSLRRLSVHDNCTLKALANVV